MRKLILIPTLLLLAAAPLAAAPMEVNETRPLAGGGTIEVEIVAGSVRITGWDRAEVNISGSIDPDYVELEIDTDDDTVSVEVEPISHTGKTKRLLADLEIRVPRGATLELESISAPFDVDDFDGDVEAETVSGSVTISGGPREVAVSTISGKVSVEASGQLRSGEFESVSGDLRLSGTLAADGRFSFETVSGNVELYLPGGTSARFDIETFSGEVRNQFGPDAEKTSIYLPSKELRFTVGSGSARVDIETMNGDIKLVQD
jgi:DUF4097 and DUF4098 domain-containing protein YvlB